MANPTLLILPGDGIGPEVMAEVRKVIAWFAAKRDIHFDISEGLVGGCSYDVHGTPLTDATMARAMAADAVLLGAVGGPEYDGLDFSVKPERGLLRLRKEMDLFSNLRPAQCFDALADFSSLKREVVAGLDIVIVRELTGGVCRTNRRFGWDGVQSRLRMDAITIVRECASECRGWQASSAWFWWAWF